MLVNLGHATNAKTLDTMPTTAEVPPGVLVVGVLIMLKTALPLEHNPQNVATAEAHIGLAMGVALA
jgi:hypothetical protein